MAQRSKRSFFVDTNVLLGLTFFSDRWYRDAKPLDEYGHELHTSELVVYEFCVSPEPFSDPPSDPAQENIEWSKGQGKFEDIKNRLQRPYRNYRQRIRSIDGEGNLTLERAIEVFVEMFEIRKQGEPQIRAEFEDEFEQKPVTAHYVQLFVSNLLGKIFKEADQAKQDMKTKVTVHDSIYHLAPDTKQRWKDFPEEPPKEPDRSIITDATHIMMHDTADFVLSGDSDFTVLQQIAIEYFGFGILSLAEEYSQAAKVEAD